MNIRWMSSGSSRLYWRSPHSMRIPITAQPDAVRSPDQTAVVATFGAMYRAVSTDDLDLCHAQIVHDFYAFENGQRFDGDALMLAS